MASTPTLSRWQAVPTFPSDPVMDLGRQYKVDPSPVKVDLGIGAFRTDEGKPYLLPVVQEAEKRLMAQGDRNHEYGPIDGLAEFHSNTQKLLFGAEHPVVISGRVGTVQSLSGTGSLRVGFEFLRKWLGNVPVFIPNPTWGNHVKMLAAAGFTDVKTYRYYNKESVSFDYEGLMEDLEKAPENSVVLLHLCAHNPTGFDPSKAQWENIAKLVERRRILTFFDNAYQGYATGDLNEDAYPARLFASMGLEFFCACSFAKNMGLYGERIGVLHACCALADDALRVTSQMKAVIRAMYSNPPVHFARVANLILSDPALKKQWEGELGAMAQRVTRMRQLLRSTLEENGCPSPCRDWSHITSQIGMFSFTGLSASQVSVLKQDYHIYMLENGRISVAGLTEKNIPHVASAFKAVMTKQAQASL